MFNVRHYPEAIQTDLRAIAQDALGIVGVERVTDMSAVEQLWRLSESR